MIKAILTGMVPALKKVTMGSGLKQNEPEVTAYISGLTTPLSSAQITKLNTFVSSLKTGLGITALSEAFDVMYILANETAESGLRNLVKREHDAEAVNSPTFTALEGFTGNGTSSYITTNYNPRLNRNRLTLNSASIGAYSRTSYELNTMLTGCLDTYGININRVSLLQVNGRLNNTSFVGVDLYGDYKGMFINTRNDETLLNFYQNKNGSSVSNLTTGIPNLNVYILGRNNNGLLDYGTVNQVSFTFLGRGLSQTEVNAITDAIEAYMDSNGKGVIS